MLSDMYPGMSKKWSHRFPVGSWLLVSTVFLAIISGTLLEFLMQKPEFDKIEDLAELAERSNMKIVLPAGIVRGI